MALQVTHVKLSFCSSILLASECSIDAGDDQRLQRSAEVCAIIPPDDGRAGAPYTISRLLSIKIGHLITMQALRGHNSSLLFPAVFLRASATTRLLLLLAVMDEARRAPWMRAPPRHIYNGTNLNYSVTIPYYSLICHHQLRRIAGFRASSSRDYTSSSRRKAWSPMNKTAEPEPPACPSLHCMDVTRTSTSTVRRRYRPVTPCYTLLHSYSYVLAGMYAFGQGLATTGRRYSWTAEAADVLTFCIPNSYKYELQIML